MFDARSLSLRRSWLALAFVLMLGCPGLRAQGSSAGDEKVLGERETLVQHPEMGEDPPKASPPRPMRAPANSAIVTRVPLKGEQDTHFHWKAALLESLEFASIEHAHRICCEPDTKPEFRGPWLKDYVRSVANLHGWDDGDPVMVQYVGHSIHGAIAGRIQIQNDPRGWTQEWGSDGYWSSRMRAALFSAAYGAQFKIGLFSEAMIGNVGLPNKYRRRPILSTDTFGRMAWSEFVVDPVGGTGWMLAEDLLDHYLVRRIENARPKKIFVYLTRSFLAPSRSYANILRFKRPWERETRPIDQIYGSVPGNPANRP